MTLLFNGPAAAEEAGRTSGSGVTYRGPDCAPGDQACLDAYARLVANTERVLHERKHPELARAAGEPWSPGQGWRWYNSALAGAYTVAHVMDWKQTLDIRNHPRLEEKNPVLGKHPSDSRVNTYMAASLAAHMAIAWLLPPNYREMFQGTSLLLEGLVVNHNYRIGLSVKF